MNSLTRDGHFERTVAPAFADWLHVPADSLEIAHSVSRLYSSLWIVTANHNGKPSKFYIKADSGKTQREFALSCRANALLGGQAGFVPLTIHHDAPNNLLFIGEVPGTSLESLTVTFISRPLAWYPEMRRAFAAAGAWLRAYHDLDRARGPVSDSLLHYASRREAQLAQLAKPLRERLSDLIHAVGEAEITTVHSDYAPGNIIWDGSRVGVIDYGINEWLAMSPWWDVLTFTVVMERNLALNWRTPLRVLPAARRRLLQAFLSAYGEPAAGGDRAWRACAAVRHLSLIGKAKPGERTPDPVSAWHLRRLERLLDPAGT